MRLEDMMWVEKYRPTTMEELVDQEGVKGRLRQLLQKKGELPHLMFAGPPGSGKTTMAMIVARELLGKDWRDYLLSLNASDERGIDMVRERVKTFARYSDRREGVPFRLVVLDESDEMCLHPDSKVIVGDLGALEETTLQKLYEEHGDRAFPIPSFSTSNRRPENDMGRVVVSGEADLHRIIFEDGKSVLASRGHPFFKFTPAGVDVVKTSELVPGVELADFSGRFLHCYTCGRPFYRQNGWEKYERHFCSTRCRNASFVSISAGRSLAEGGAISDLAHRRLKGSGVQQTAGYGVVVLWDHELKDDASVAAHVAPKVFETVGISGGALPRIEHSRVASVEPIGKSRVLNISMAKNRNFFLANGILTHNTSDAQTALRRIMEDSSEYTRFILICNYSTGIIEPIQSRCAIFRFQRYSPDVVEAHLKEIARKEKVKVEGAGVFDAIYEATQGDLRQAINILQASSPSGSVDVEKVKVVTGASVKKRVAEIMAKALDGQFEAARSAMTELTRVYGTPERDFLRFANEAVGSMKLKKLPKVISIIAEYDFRLVQGAQPELQLTAMLAELSALNEGKDD